MRLVASAHRARVQPRQRVARHLRVVGVRCVVQPEDGVDAGAQALNRAASAAWTRYLSVRDELLDAEQRARLEGIIEHEAGGERP